MIPKKLENAPWLAKPEVQAIFSVLDGASGTTRAVGGIVRDTLMGRLAPEADIDMATELLPVTVMQRAKMAGIAVYPTGIDHGTVTLRLNDVSIEVTTLRKDVTTDGRHAEVAFGTDWAVDASRRDFTFNALYCGPDGTLFDPLGGAGDALNSRVRFIGDPARRIAEDGLRVYRFFRFSASHGDEKLDPAGLAACQAAVGKLDHISAERVGQEVVRMLGLPRIALTVAVMVEIGLIAIERDAVKALLRYEMLGGRHAATRLALIAGDDGRALQERWRLSNALVDAAKAIEDAARFIAQDKTAWAVHRHKEISVEGLALAAARGHWSRDRLAETAREIARLPEAHFPVSGRDLIDYGYRAGPELGAALARLEALWVESGFTLTQAQLLARLAH
ncbi:CCA tRNA nucleotidyltransferase [Devosia sp. FJ2-5-3]|uniref:CCA tRNA nucleotidyltransferase n=1 Tax=Devosia sp. FJ2-5-3 TaxID=2976680 RepID=UPI0023D83315|nr:CCA tRNA nucleotidyltransferase [Devosia sp. FJ2-5-3]WEJ59545.1 CCA tRNA nucleotidyltransferase [Devosia sp. FJ2-5-3]